MNRVVFIIPYFGVIPPMWMIWKETVIHNEKFDFLIFTDIEELKSEKNLHIVNIEFKNLKKQFENKLKMEINLKQPYKLCDFRPAYGVLFEDYIKGYEFWGYCDLDLLFGDIGTFITEDILDRYEKILEHGHLTCYKNTIEINTIFKNDGQYPEYNYQEVFVSPESFYFDEVYGMMAKCRRQHLKTWYSPDSFFDIKTNIRSFQNAVSESDGNCHFHYKDGRLYVCSGDQGEKQILYAHFQKRKMDFKQLADEKRWKEFWIIPNKAIVNETDVDTKTLMKLYNLNYSLKFKIKHIGEFVKRYRMVKETYRSIFAYYKSRQKFKERRSDIDRLISSSDIFENR
ncbi:MAG: DUF6625 family protein [Lachnospiraceae bacterium]